jgi:hypothetical protein
VTLDGLARDAVGAGGHALPGGAKTLLDPVEADDIDPAGEHRRLAALPEQLPQPILESAFRLNGNLARRARRPYGLIRRIEQLGEVAPEPVEHAVSPRHHRCPRSGKARYR